ncbi:MAG TPA: hypothetical protein VF172_02105 [Nitrososphaera sp.]
MTTSQGNSGGPVSYHRSISESLAVTANQGKAPSSFSRSMSEHVALSTETPPPAISSPAPYSAGSNQRTDERQNPIPRMLGKRTDATKKVVGGTPYLAMVSVTPASPGPPDQYSEMDETSGQDSEPDDNSVLARQVADLNDDILVQQSILKNTALLNASVSAVLLAGTGVVLVAGQPVVLGGRVQKSMYAIFLLKHAVIEDIDLQRKSRVPTRILLLLAIIFTIPSIAVSRSMLSAQAAPICAEGICTQIFTEPGTSVVPEGVTGIRVQVWEGGGGAGSAGDEGGAAGGTTGPGTPTNGSNGGTHPGSGSEVGGAGQNYGAGGAGRRITRAISLLESLAVSSAVNTRSEAFKDINDLLGVSETQGQPLHKHVITIHNVTVTLNVVDVRSSGFGLAVATLNFEITNTGRAPEKLTLRYWYGSGDTRYENSQQLTISNGEYIAQRIEVPFSSTGSYNIMVEARTEDQSILTTNIVVEVPWLAVNLYLLVIIAVAVVTASLAYMIYFMRNRFGKS